MISEPTFFDVPVRDGALRVARWGTGPRVVLGIHGITASAISMRPLARQLGAEFSLVAPDLRGRGQSADLPGPFGIDVHAADCAAVLEQLGSWPAVVVGESMGGFVSVVLAATRPELVERLVLVDGGLPLAVPEGLDPDVVLEAILGPSIERLGRTFPSREAYREFWRPHPALQEEWNEDVEAYLDYDLIGEEPDLRSRVSQEAVRGDGRATLERVDLLTSSLEALRCPVVLVRAPRDVMNRPTPLQPDELVAQWREKVPQLKDEVVEDTNHYTIVFGERGAKTIAEHVRGATP